MSFLNIHQQYKNLDFTDSFAGYSDNDVLSALQKDSLSTFDLLALLSPCAENHLEAMAQIAQRLTFQNFGKTIVLYTPLYISDFCDNYCAYCGFKANNNIARKKLTLSEIEQEAQQISSSGVRHLLILTGDSRKHSPLSYIKEAVILLKKYFTALSIEIYALNEDEYCELIEAGVDGLTIYQETYNAQLYAQLHTSGPKKDFIFRLDAPERACKVGIRSINIGALMGLDEWRKEVFFTLLHGQYLQDKYTDTEISISYPRLRPHKGQFEVAYPVKDIHFVQMILATRIFLKRAGITVSTRESASLRDNILGLGVTRMSVGSNTAVGGYTMKNKSEQFEISDDREIDNFKKDLLSKGFEPVFKDWQNFDI